jgi:predicted Zn-dependent peptidase
MKYKYRNHPSRMSTLMVTFGAGARASLGKYPDGIAHFCEHAVFKASTKYTAKQLLWKIASAGGNWNAFTSEDLVAYHVTIPEENLDVAFECISEITTSPTFPADELVKEKEVICQEIRMYDDEMGTKVGYALRQAIFDNPLATPILGTEESVRSITRDNLVAFNREFYSPEQRLVTLCAQSNAFGLVGKYFGKPNDVLVFGPPNAPNYKPSSDQEITKPGHLQHMISIAFAGPGIDTLTKNRAAFDVFNRIFGGGDVSRLFLKIREDLGLVYGVGSTMCDFMDGNYFYIGTETEPENSNQVVAEINNQIDVMQSVMSTDEELRTAKNKIRSGIYSRMDTSNGTVGFVLDEEFYGQPDTSQYLAAVDQVTAAQVQEIAQKVFAEPKYTVIGHG